MNTPNIEEPTKLAGLYMIDFGQHSASGFTRQEVTELLESEKFQDIKVFRIHNAYPDGKMELKGVPNQLFQLEAGLFFYAYSEQDARTTYTKLGDLAVTAAPPAMAKLQLAKYDDQKFVTAIIYPAECDSQFSDWLLDNKFNTNGPAAGGISEVKNYYTQKPQIIERRQLFNAENKQHRTGQELLKAIKAG
jgi:hypothetical protein